MRENSYRKYEVNDLGQRLAQACRDEGENPVSIERIIVFMREYFDYISNDEKNKEADYFIINDFSTYSGRMIRMAGVLSVRELGWIRRILVKVGMLDVVSDQYIWYNDDKYSHPLSEDHKPRPKTFGMDRNVGEQIEQIYNTIHWTRLEKLRSQKEWRATKPIQGREEDEGIDVSLYDKDPAINGILRQARALTREVREYNKHETEEKCQLRFKAKESVPKRNEPKKRRISGRAYAPLCSMKKEGENSRSQFFNEIYEGRYVNEYDVKSSIARVADCMINGVWRGDDYDFYTENNPYPGFFPRDVFKKFFARAAFIYTPHALRLSIDKATYPVAHFWDETEKGNTDIDLSNPEHQERIDEIIEEQGGLEWVKACRRWQKLKSRDKKRMTAIIMKEAEKVYGKNRGADIFITESLIYVRLANVLRRKYGVKVKMVYDCLYSDDSRLEYLCQQELPRIARRVYNDFFKNLTLQAA